MVRISALMYTHFTHLAGLHFETSSKEVLKQIGLALQVFIQGAELFTAAYPYSGLRPQLSCEGQGQVRWNHGELFYRSVPSRTAGGERELIWSGMTDLVIWLT